MTSFSLHAAGLAATCLAVAACASGTGSVGSPSTPAPRPGDPPASAEPTGGRGPAVSFRAVRNMPYRIERHDSLTLQYEGGARQEQIRDRIAFVRVTLTEAPEGVSQQATILLDSLLAWENGIPVPADSTGLVRGTQWTATLTPDGGLQGLRPSRSSTLGDELGSVLRLLFPRLPRAGVREGMEWTDTTRFELVADAFPGTETAISSYRAVEAEGRDSKALDLESTGSYSRAGTRLQGEQELQMTASGSREGVHRLGLAGALLSAQGTEAGEMTISVPALGQTVPVKRSASYRITSTASDSR